MPWQLEQEVTNAVGAAPGVDAVSQDEDSETVDPAVPPPTTVAPALPPPTTVLPALPPPMTVLPALLPLVDDPELPAELDVSPEGDIDPGVPLPGFVCPEQPTLAAIAQRLAATATMRAVNAALSGFRFEIMRSPSVETARHVTLVDFAGPRS
ncbi:MAG TPA: hypothetical protein VH560_18035 [Polyangia bacterium]|jgi:hypothetical protein|nr:hypothetical protein [Polyangia bacterium]